MYIYVDDLQLNSFKLIIFYSSFTTTKKCKQVIKNWKKLGNESSRGLSKFFYKRWALKWMNGNCFRSGPQKNKNMYKNGHNDWQISTITVQRTRILFKYRKIRTLVDLLCPYLSRRNSWHHPQFFFHFHFLSCCCKNRENGLDNVTKGTSKTKRIEIYKQIRNLALLSNQFVEVNLELKFD